MPAGDDGATTPGGAVFTERYEVIAPISSGAMGAVYRAVDRETGSEVAIKRLLDVRHAARFEIEARLLSSLSHPRVVKVLDHAGDEEGLYIVMELVRGTDLGAQLKDRGQPGLPPQDAIEYARHACEALQYVHDQQIVHRDVKPQNLILAESGVVLVDFGVARAIGSDETVGTIAVGTPRYMAPEVFAGGTVSSASDIFSLAATLWTLMVGAPPRYGDVLKIDKVAPELPPELREALAGGLEMLPEMRISSAIGVRGGDRRPDLRARRPVAGPEPRPRARAPARHRGDRAHRGRHVRGGGLPRSRSPTRPRSELVYEAAWGAGASEVVGMRLPPGAGLAGAVVASGEGVAVPECRNDPRFAQQVAARTGYVPYTMLDTPLIREGKTIGVLALLDRRDGGPYRHEDLARAALFADLAVVALDLDTFPLSTTGGRTRL